MYEANAPGLDARILELNIPLLGLCYGHQLVAHMMGGTVQKGLRREYGAARVIIYVAEGVLQDTGPVENVWTSHSDTVVAVPEDVEVQAHSSDCPIAAFRHKTKPIYGVQWHPEVAHTERGGLLLDNFVFRVCKCERSWDPGALVDQLTSEISQQTRGRRAVIALSGGIDSGTAAILASRSLGGNLLAVFVDHGFMRDGEPQTVEASFRRLGVNVTIAKEERRFSEKLRGVVEPEEKRRIIGEEFIRVFEDIAAQDGAEYLIQGTIYPDRIESGARKHSDKIKTHHNVAGLPSRMSFKGIVEPLKDLYKDEVRVLAAQLKMPQDIIQRQPFPGPGLAVRVVGEVTPERVLVARKADSIVTEEIEKSPDIRARLWQYFAVLTGAMSTGVKGDQRAYGHVIAVRIVESQEAMTASFSKIPYEILERISTRITNEIPEVARVVYDISHKPPATIEWE